jgi:hypothetical protein
MKSWLSWLKGDSYLASKNPLIIFGRFILSLWVAILLLTGVIVGGIFLSDPKGFSPPEPEVTCTVVEHNGEAIDTCEFLDL